MGQSRGSSYSVSVQTEQSETGHSKKKLIHNGNEQMANTEVIFSHQEVAIGYLSTSTALPIRVNIIINTPLGIFFLISLFCTLEKLLEVRANPDIGYTD